MFAIQAASLRCTHHPTGGGRPSKAPPHTLSIASRYENCCTAVVLRLFLACGLSMPSGARALSMGEGFSSDVGQRPLGAASLAWWDCGKAVESAAAVCCGFGLQGC